MAKVILTDNYMREEIADELLAENLTDEDAKRIADEYNAKHGQNFSFGSSRRRDFAWEWFAKVVPDCHKLWGGIAEFI